jgi:pseudouridine synthase
MPPSKSKKSASSKAKSAEKNTDPLRDASRGVRLQRYLADSGVASRRKCEELVEEGLVRVNGRLVTELPAWVDPESDEVSVDGKRVRAERRNIYVMLNKPRRSMTTASDPGGRRTVVEMVDHPSGVRLFPVGRLDYETSGLLLLTNDGDLANALTHPRFGVEKTYRAIVKGRLDEAACTELEEGLFLAERKQGRTVGAKKTLPVRVRLVKRDRDRTVLDLTIKEGRNRQLRRMLAQVECPVKRLTRVSMGPLKLKGLSTGEWRELSREELQALRAAVKRGSKTSKAKDSAG